jgi:hypothetical protein
VGPKASPRPFAVADVDVFWRGWVYSTSSMESGRVGATVVVVGRPEGDRPGSSNGLGVCGRREWSKVQSGLRLN